MIFQEKVIRKTLFGNNGDMRQSRFCLTATAIVAASYQDLAVGLFKMIISELKEDSDYVPSSDTFLWFLEALADSLDIVSLKMCLTGAAVALHLFFVT